MNSVLFSFCVLTVAGWIHPGQQNAIEYLMAENRVLREQISGRRLRLTDDQRRTLAVRAKTVGRAGLQGLATIVTPDTLLRGIGRSSPRSTLARAVAVRGARALRHPLRSYC